LNHASFYLFFSNTEDNMVKNESIGFIGLGRMGKPMAENLLAAGYRLRVFNRSADKAVSLAESGATVVATPADTAETGGIVMSCVADDAALEAVMGRSGELAERLGKGGVHVSMSTVLPETADALSRRHAACGGCYVAAPVMGRPDVVKAAKQSYYIAGDAAAKDRIRPVLEAIGKRIFDFGENPADANTAKLGANFLIAASIEAMSEAFTLVEKNGVDPATAFCLQRPTAVRTTTGPALRPKSGTRPAFDRRSEQASSCEVIIWAKSI
jgi:3-hydroxyisobutyrate dehydrogenase-like beta-hydroxyacid dehydrogenase